ncbi:MAG: 5'/3'-nucleotidase SurE, partial [Longimicrobiales bacterium]|nr:5'/3'-nucleotidase SurE [Longimicrobiales bacterium]
MPRLHRTEIPSPRPPNPRRGRSPRPGASPLHWIVAVLALCIVLPGGLRAQDARSDTRSDAETLRILLTNDDGYRAPGIGAVHEALTAAGHDVVLIAPT